MTILFNNEPIKLPNDQMTLFDLAKWKNIPQQGAAIAVNDRLIKRALWNVTDLNEFDRITVITAAYGG